MKTLDDGIKFSQFRLMMDSAAIDRLIVNQSEDGRFSLTGEYSSATEDAKKKLTLVADKGNVRLFAKLDTLVLYIKKNFGTKAPIELVLH